MQLKYLCIVLLFISSLILQIDCAYVSCSQTIGGYHYDITPLADAWKSADIKVSDSNNNNYFYRPCQNPVQAGCATTTVANAGLCQASVEPKYYNLGQLSQVSWAPSMLLITILFFN